MKSKRKKESKNQPECRLAYREQHLSSNSSINLNNEYENTRNDLEQIYLSEAEGALIRSRLQWIEEGEKSKKNSLAWKKNIILRRILEN